MNRPATINDYQVTCFICREQWTLRLLAKLPKQCPRCGNRHWNKPAAVGVSSADPSASMAARRQEEQQL